MTDKITSLHQHLTVSFQRDPGLRGVRERVQPPAAQPLPGERQPRPGQHSRDGPDGPGGLGDAGIKLSQLSAVTAIRWTGGLGEASIPHIQLLTSYHKCVKYLSNSNISFLYQ